MIIGFWSFRFTRLLTLGITVGFPAALWAQPKTFTNLPDSPVDFTFQLGVNGQGETLSPANQCFTPGISSGSNLNFSVSRSVTTPAGVNWLTVSPGNGTTGTTQICISANARGLAPGGSGYQGNVRISASGVTTANIQILLSVQGDRRLVRSPDLLPFSATAGAAPPDPQSITLTTALGQHKNGPLLYRASVATQSGGNWISVTPGQGTAPDFLSVFVSQASLPPGTYRGTVTFFDTTNSVSTSVQAVVVLTVTAPTAILTAAPGSFSFSHQVGNSPPPAQDLSVTSSGGIVDYQIASSASWLTVTPANGSTAGSHSVAVNPAGFGPGGTYNSVLTITGVAANSPLTVPVSLAVRSGIQVLSQIADGAGWKTTIILVNLDSESAVFTLRFWNGNGTPLLLALEGSAGKSDTVNGTLPVGGSRTIQTLGADATLSQGWAQLEAGRRISGLAVFRQRVPGRPDQEAAVDLTNTTSRFLLPFDNTQNFVTALALANTSSSQGAGVTATPRQESGSALAGGVISLAPRNQTAFPLVDRLPSAAGQRGVAEFTASIADAAALGLRFHPQGAFTSFPALTPPAAKASNQLLSQVADGAGWKTTIILVNLDTEATPFTLRFWKDDGTPMTLGFEGGGAASQTIEGTIPVGGAQTILTLGTADALSQGWAELVTTKLIGGLAVFRQRVAGRPDQEAAVGITSSGSRFSLPFDNTQGFVTSMALVNTSTTQNLTIAVTLREEGGMALAPVDPITLGPRSHTAFSLPTRFPGVANLRGVVEFSASSPDMSGLGLRFHPQGAFTSFAILSP
jgi:hypothetical protein